MLKREITAGTGEKRDARITVAPNAGGWKIELARLPHPRFRDAVTAVAEAVLREEQIQDAYIRVEDFGALDFVLEARLRAALREAEKEAL
nr:hypothetical protein [uncultured Oscillibacter sp.]